MIKPSGDHPAASSSSSRFDWRKRDMFNPAGSWSPQEKEDTLFALGFPVRKALHHSVSLDPDDPGRHYWRWGCSTQRTPGQRGSSDRSSRPPSQRSSPARPKAKWNVHPICRPQTLYQRVSIFHRIAVVDDFETVRGSALVGATDQQGRAPDLRQSLINPWTAAKSPLVTP